MDSLGQILRGPCVAIAALILIAGCTEDVFVTDLGNTRLVTRDTVTTDLVFRSYQTPPQVGSHKNLFLGRHRGFNVPYTLIRLQDLSLLSDSSITLLSAFFQLTLAISDSALQEGTYTLGYFPLDPSYGFSDSSTNFVNDEWVTEPQDPPILSETVVQEDTVADIVHVRFDVDTSLVRTWADTLSVDPLFILKSQQPLSEIVMFHSGDSESNGPFLRVTYQDTAVVDSVIVTDTTHVDINVEADVSIIEPPLIAEDNFDSTVVYVGTAVGLKTLAYANIESLDLPEEAVVLRADLILQNAVEKSSLISDPSFEVKISALTNPGTGWMDQVWPTFLEVDTLTAGTPFSRASLDVSKGTLKLPAGSVIQPIVSRGTENVGFKLEPFSSKSVFDYAAFVPDSLSDLSPRLEVLYEFP